MLPLRAIVAAALLAASPAHAGPRRVPPIQLVYVKGAGAEACPEVDGLRRAVFKEMGYDPFVDDGGSAPKPRVDDGGSAPKPRVDDGGSAPKPRVDDGAPPGVGRLRVSIERRVGQLEAAMEMRDDAGEIVWSVEPMRSRSDCRTLVEALGLVIVIRIDTVPTPAPPRTCPVPREITPSPARPAPQSAPSVAAPGVDEGGSAAATPVSAGLRRPLLFLGGGPLVALASPIAVAPGLSVVAELRGSFASLSFEVRGLLPGAGGRQGQRIDASSFAGVIAPCARLDPFFACALIEGGAVVLTGPAAPSPTRALALASAGFRAGLERRLSRRLALRGHADLLGTLVHEQALVDSSFIWSAPEVAGVIGVELMIASRGSLSGDARVSSTPSTKEAAP